MADLTWLVGGFVVLLILCGLGLEIHYRRTRDRDPFDGQPVVPVDQEAAEAMAKVRAAGLAGTRLNNSSKDDSL